MRPTLPRWRCALATIGAVVIAIPTSAVALAAGEADAQSATALHVSARHLRLGERLRVAGSASSANAGQTLLLEFAQAGTTSWQTLGSTRVRPDGGFSFITRLRHSGALRVRGAPATSAVPASNGPGGVELASQLLAGHGSLASDPERVSVAASIHAQTRSFDVLAGRQITVLGGLLPGRDGRKVLLQGRTNGAWQTLARGRSGDRGGFHVNYVARALGVMQLRLKFPGDRLNTGATTRAGEVSVLRPAVASWYDDAGQTACGFHAHFGVANVSLPCGTSVTFRYRGRTVTAVVDDRGPYVGGRVWDLNQNTAGALGFGGVDTVWSSL